MVKIGRDREAEFWVRKTNLIIKSDFGVIKHKFLGKYLNAMNLSRVKNEIYDVYRKILNS